MQDRAEDRNRPIELERTKARQGFLGLPVLYVLIGGLVLAVVAWAVVELTVR
jgi:hypothetical protein